MPKKDIHPKQHTIAVTMTDCVTKFNIQTTYGKEGGSLKLDSDPKNHQAWQEKGAGSANSSNQRVKDFNKKFGDFF